MTKKSTKTVAQYKIELAEYFYSACEVSSFNSPQKNQAMWELLCEGSIVPLSSTLWMTTKDAFKKYAAIA
jgi:hypothetical protein